MNVQKTGVLVEDKDQGKCPKAATPSKSSAHPKRQGSPSPDQASSPSPNKSDEKNGSQPSKEQPSKEQAYNFVCPQEDVAKNPLTNKAIQDSALDCSYTTGGCKYNAVRWNVERIW